MSPSPSRALVTGATGLLGRRLVGRLRPGGVTVLVRDPTHAKAELGDVRAIAWNAGDAVPSTAFEGVDAVFHLAGEPVASGRWTDEHKKRIEESRVHGTRQIVEAMRALDQRPRVLVCASAIGFYGSRGDELLNEESAPGPDFLAQVCVKWEEEARAAEALGVRVVCARIGMVLAPRGGALERMLPIFRLGLGGPLGSGAQWISWVHLDDAVGLLDFAASNDELRGAMNVVAPNPVTNAELTREIAQAVHRPALFRAPAAALRLALGGMADVVLASQRVVPDVATRNGYLYAHAALADALRAVLSGR